MIAITEKDRGRARELLASCEWYHKAPLTKRINPADEELVAGALAAAREEPAWNDATFANPTVAGYYLVRASGSTEKAYWSKQGRYFGWTIPCVSHWMPLPAPPPESR